MSKTLPGDARLRVRYAETDQMGVVYHANYLIWFEVGRVERMRALGFDYHTLEKDEGCLIAVVEVNARYRKPARYDDELVIRTRIEAVRPSMLKFTYAVVREADGMLLCAGHTTHVVVGRDMQKRVLPPQYLLAFRAAAEADTRLELQGA